MRKEYLIIIEKSETGFSAYVPDLPGCFTVGDTIGETKLNMKEAIEFHLEGLREDNLEIPLPVSQAALL